MAMARLLTGLPVQMGEGSKIKITTVATAANFASTRYSRRIKVLAPCLISRETSWILAFSVFCFFTHRYR